MEFLDLIETVKASELDVDRLYRGDGTRVRSGNTTRYKQALAEATKLYGAVLSGRKPIERLKEAMSTSDFSYLFADIIDRQMLAAYAEWPVMWQSLAKRGVVRDFRQVKRFTLDGGQGVLGEVKQLEEYPAASVADGAYTYQVKKYGRRLPFSWEMFVNDDLDALRGMPQRLAAAARRSEEKFATQLFAGPNGPNSTFFASGNSNIVTSNPALSITALQTAMTVIGAQRDADGNPIYIDAVNLVVPPALEVVANNIINATQILTAVGSGGTSSDAGRQDRLTVANWMQNRVKVVVDPWLPIVSTTNGNTSWYLIADPNVGRPAMEIGFLAGHESPELFQKSPNAVRVGGGLVAPEDGDFGTDAVEHKVRHVFGGVLMDPKAAVASNGTGS